MTSDVKLSALLPLLLPFIIMLNVPSAGIVSRARRDRCLIAEPNRVDMTCQGLPLLRRRRSCEEAVMCCLLAGNEKSLA
jgi:hypothetical protein